MVGYGIGIARTEFLVFTYPSFVEVRARVFFELMSDEGRRWNFVEILGKLCFARLKLNLKTEDRFKLKTKLGFFFFVGLLRSARSTNPTFGG